MSSDCDIKKPDLVFDDILRNTTHGVTPWRLRAGLIKIRIVIKPGNPTLWQGLSVRSSLNYYNLTLLRSLPHAPKQNT